MQTVDVTAPTKNYAILAGCDLWDSEPAVDALRDTAGGRRALLVTDDTVRDLYAGRATAMLDRADITTTLTSFPAGERSKHLDTVRTLYSRAVAAGLDRQSVIVALGGGVPGDIAGFVAATYMRGIPFIQIPTTLLAMVDSAVGGKVGVDLPHGKNLVGAFHQPELVLANVNCLETLPEREMHCGLAEVVKYGVIMDEPFFTELEDMTDALRARNLEAFESVVARCCQLKAAIVRQDEREAGRRAILNYGHTFGHALEAACGYAALSHGEAVAVGMGMAMDLAVRKGMVSQDAAQRQEALLRRLDLDTRLADDRVTDIRKRQTGSGTTETARNAGEQAPFAESIVRLMQHDKKAVSGTLRLILPTAIGSVDMFEERDMELLKTVVEGRCGSN